MRKPMITPKTEVIEITGTTQLMSASGMHNSVSSQPQLCPKRFYQPQ